MSLKKVIALLLCLLFLAEGLVACSGGDDGGKETKETAETPGGSETDERDVRELSDVPDDLRFDGATFTFITRNTAGSIYAEEIKGEKVNDAVYQRNTLTEERFGITITEEKSEDTKLDELVQSINAGEQRYAAAMTHITKMCNFMRDGYLLNTDDIPYLDFSKPYWAKTVVDSLSIDDRHYLFSGDISITDNANIWCVYFNKVMASNYSLPSFYDAVENGTWTIDLYESSGKKVAQDLNNDNSWDFQTDQFAVINLYETLCGMYNGMGQLSVVRDSEGEMTYNMGSEESVNVMLRITDWLKKGQNSYYLDISRIPDEDWDILHGVFTAGRALFDTHTVVTIFRHIDMEEEFGILPMPKADEKQANYVSSTQEWGQCVLGIPICTPDQKMSGAVLEYMSGVSTDTVRAAYYDQALTRRYSRDKESSISLDIIFDNIVIDPGFCFFSLRGTLEDALKEGVVASTIKKKEKSVNNSIKTYVKAISKLKH